MKPTNEWMEEQLLSALMGQCPYEIPPEDEETAKEILRDVVFGKAEKETAMYLLLDKTLPLFDCEKIKQEGNYRCDRCDDCMFEQYVKKAKSGELPRKVRGC